MPPIEPLPFRIAVPGRDKLELAGARSISWSITGLLHHEVTQLAFEWEGTRRTQGLTLGGAVDRVDQVPAEVVEVPIELVAEAWLTGGWWLPRFIVRGRRLDVFDGLPGALAGRAVLRIERRHRDIAQAMAAEINR
ncbi:MAG TPA: hypothetical protein VLA95_03385 [Gemmatimonadales bacterium]|jgi:hypothetical protein|nr:hypothetical protein [Gemmatimonadales bacterium]